MNNKIEKIDIKDLLKDYQAKNDTPASSKWFDDSNSIEFDENGALSSFQTKYGAPSANLNPNSNNSGINTNGMLSSFQTKYGAPSCNLKPNTNNNQNELDTNEMLSSFQTKYGSPSCDINSLINKK